MTVIGIVSPGAMGSALGRAWASGGARVVATVVGRSARTQSLARGLDLVPSLADVVAASDLVISICPPREARAVLDDVLAAARTARVAPVLADLNAVSPGLVEELAGLAAAAGHDFVDGSISGGPPTPGGDTTLFLSGEGAPWLGDLPADGLRRRVVGESPGTASAVKMCTASVYKGTALVWLQALLTAERLGVLDHVVADLGEEYPDEVRHAARSLAMAASKSGRYVAEMEQIAATQESAGVGSALFTGMAAGYERVAGTPLAELSPEDARSLDDLHEVLRRLDAAPRGAGDREPTSDPRAP